MRKPMRPSKLKICHVVATTEGASWVFDQLRGLRDRYGHEVSVVLNGASGRLVDWFRAEAIPVHVVDFDFTSSPDLLGLPRKVLALAQLFRRERFDVVQTHLFHSMIIGRIAGWIAHVPVRLSMIAGPFHLEAYTPRWIDRATAWMDTGIIASCEHTLKLYRACGVSPRRLGLIYYGPDESKFDPANLRRGLVRQEFGWPADTPLIGMVAIFYTLARHDEDLLGQHMLRAACDVHHVALSGLRRARPLRELRSARQARFLASESRNRVAQRGVRPLRNAPHVCLPPLWRRRAYSAHSWPSTDVPPGPTCWRKWITSAIAT
jgi:glycosyltransferase involved in cell wall biosynthesis